MAAVVEQRAQLLHPSAVAVAEHDVVEMVELGQLIDSFPGEARELLLVAGPPGEHQLFHRLPRLVELHQCLAQHHVLELGRERIEDSELLFEGLEGDERPIVESLEDPVLDRRFAREPDLRIDRFAEHRRHEPGLHPLAHPGRNAQAREPLILLFEELRGLGGDDVGDLLTRPEQRDLGDQTAHRVFRREPQVDLEGDMVGGGDARLDRRRERPAGLRTDMDRAQQEQCRSAAAVDAVVGGRCPGIRRARVSRFAERLRRMTTPGREAERDECDNGHGARPNQNQHARVPLGSVYPPAVVLC